jgi:hypothetical protein
MGWFDSVISGIILVGACSGIAFFISAFIACTILDAKDRMLVLPAVLGVAVIGAAAGISGGLSRVAAVGQVIPAALSLVGTISVYIFAVKTDSETATHRAALSVLSFALSLSLGFSAGASKRQQSDFFTSILTQCDNVLYNPQILQSAESFTRTIDIHGETCARMYAIRYNSISSEFRGSSEKAKIQHNQDEAGRVLFRYVSARNQAASLLSNPSGTATE